MPTFSFPEAPPNPSRVGFVAAGMLPYRSLLRARSFGARLDARKFSMPDRSTSELLRTL